jgi:CheY-like chemotaxis protein
MSFRNILLIDDDEDDHEIFLTAVQSISSSVTCRALYNAKEALELLKENKLNPEVIFLDLNMPVMNGQQFLTEIKKDKELKNIPVIIFSTSSHQPTIELMKELGAHDFITKPERYDSLIALLTPIISNQQHHPNNLGKNI